MVLGVLLVSLVGGILHLPELARQPTVYLLPKGVPSVTLATQALGPMRVELATQVARSDSLIGAALKARGLVVATWMKPERLTADFDGDGKPDVALLVVHVKSNKRGVLFVHAGRTTPRLIGAGVTFGNGGDDFEWANRWTVVKRNGKPDALLVEREESGGGLVEFVGGRYRWRQWGD